MPFIMLSRADRHAGDWLDYSGAGGAVFRQPGGSGVLLQLGALGMAVLHLQHHQRTGGIKPRA